MANNTRREITLGRDLERKRGTEGSVPKGRELPNNNKTAINNGNGSKATGNRDLSKLGENVEREQSRQSKKNDVALEIIERTEFLRPLLYAQDIDLYNEDPSSGGYIKGRYVGKGTERRFERGDSSGHKDYLENSTITDIGFDGNHLYVVDNEIGHYRVNDPEKDPRIKEGLPPIKVTASDVDTLARNVSNQMGEKYTTASPIFDAELGYLRTNFVHPSVAPYGNTMALRVSRPSLAIKDLSDMATPEVNELLKVFMRTRTNLLISGSTGAGKAAADSELVPTPKGIVRHGDLKVGDLVYDRMGKTTKVEAIFPQGELDVYEVELKDGRKVRVSGDHNWLSRRYTHGYRENTRKDDNNYYEGKEIYGKTGWEIRTTEEMLEDGVVQNLSNGRVKYKYYLPNGGGVEKTPKEYKLHPYAMGAFLGDGCLTEKALTLSSGDEFVVEKVAKLIGSPNYKKDKHGYSWKFDLPEDFNVVEDGYDVRTKLFQTRMFFNESDRDLCGTRAIPEEYFEGSIEQRYQLLQGLMDTDGLIARTNGRYPVTFKVTSKQLAEDVQRLGRSLGMEMTLQEYPYELPEREGVDREDRKRVAYHVRFNIPHSDKVNIFTLPRKVKIAKECQGKKQKRLYNQIAIVSIKKLGYKENMQCIMVDNEEHLYQLHDGVVTHNTEVQKSMVGYIPIEQKITLMEDTLDSHIKEIYPEKDINSWRTVINEDDTKVADNIDFHTLLRAALRNFPDWAMVSEVRGSEAGALLSVALSGHAVMTTMHTQGAESIPERLADMVSMGNSMMDYGALQRNILSVFKIGVHLERGVDPDTGKTIRYIREIYEFVDYDKDNGVIGYPIYRRYQQYDNETETYKVRKQHYRMSDDMLRRLEDNRELDNIPSVFRRGDYEHKTMADRRNITKGDDV